MSKKLFKKYIQFLVFKCFSKLKSLYQHLSSIFFKIIYFIKLLLLKNVVIKKISNFVFHNLGLCRSLFFKIFPKKYKKVNFIFFIGAVLFSMGIFYFMSILISTGKNLHTKREKNVSINFLLNAVQDNLELRTRRLPKKPKEEEAPPETPKIKTQQVEMDKPELSPDLPQLELPDDFQSDTSGASVGRGKMRDSAVTPVFRMNPSYPRKAALQNIEGFVILRFDITETGGVDNILVIQASPPQIFNSSAVQALRKWKYKPRIEDGKAMRQKHLKVQLDFRLNAE